MKDLFINKRNVIILSRISLATLTMLICRPRWSKAHMSTRTHGIQKVTSHFKPPS